MHTPFGVKGSGSGDLRGSKSPPSWENPPKRNIPLLRSPEEGQGVDVPDFKMTGALFMRRMVLPNDPAGSAIGRPN